MGTVAPMPLDDLFTADGDDAVVLTVHAQPGAGRTQVVGRHGAALKIRVAAPPEGGRANDAVLALLAERLGVPASAVALVSGASSRSKRVRVTGVEPAGFGDRLERIVDEDAATGKSGRGRRPGR
jgi:uncharacterized protein (TIGR00251 family)